MPVGARLVAFALALAAAGGVGHAAVRGRAEPHVRDRRGP
jgi:hypothetical protein